MQDHGCTFSKYCYGYEQDRCQGCYRNRVRDPFRTMKNETVEKIKTEINQIIKQGRPSKSTVRKESSMKIKRVHFNKPLTIVLWEDGTKTFVKCQNGDAYSKETGLAMAIAKKALGNKGNFNEVFKKWIPEYGQEDETRKE